MLYSITMNTKVSKILLLVVVLWQACACAEVKHSEWKWPTVFIAVLVRNKAHTLPYFLTCLHNLDYPKDNIHIWAYTDYTDDSSLEVLEKWSLKYGAQYHGVNITSNESTGPLHGDEEKPSHWSPAHFRHVIRLRDEALDVARMKWAENIFMLDADVFLTNSNTLKLLVSKNLKIVAPMLISDGVYSNFWCGMTEQYYYKRTDKYRPILSREEIGCFPVPMVHSAVLVNLKLVVSDLVTYDPRKINNYNGPEDDIIAFAINAKNLGLPLNICNDNIYGFVPVPLDDNADLTVDKEQLLNVKLEAIGQGHPLPLDPMFDEDIAYPVMWKFNCDQIYMINLERRVERRTMMERSLKELGMDAKIFKAVDGRELDLNHLEKFSVTFMPNYEDPFHKRPMKAGEVGCFLSHYNIWEEIIANGYKTALVLEDDVHFTPFFRHKFLNLLKELKDFDWDLVYIGRKILLDADEVAVSKSMVRPLYSYWTLGYLVSQRGAKKLVDAGPLRKMLPVDEYLPIMFDQHPNATWKAHFPHRSLAAFSAAPLLVQPTHYTGEPGYISDTEDSSVLPARAPARGERSDL